uniref:Uncharacterized protein n=1 Tax=Parascaris univalens TaxID=6257 RepID=A0A915AV07_PARUN
SWSPPHCSVIYLLFCFLKNVSTRRYRSEATVIAIMKVSLESDGVRSSLMSEKLKTHFKEDEKSFGSYLFLVLIILVALIVVILWFIALIARQKDREEKLRARAEDAQIEQFAALDRKSNKMLQRLDVIDESRQKRRRWTNNQLKQIDDLNLRDFSNLLAHV